MKHALFSLFLLVISNMLFSQTIVNLDNYTISNSTYFSKTNSANTKSFMRNDTAEFSLTEIQTIEELISTIEGVFFENGEHINVAKERRVPCLKADADIPTFLEFTNLEKNRKELITACYEIELIRLSIFNNNDFELAKSIDFSILNKFPQLKYVVFYVNSSIDKSDLEDERKEKIKQKLEVLISKIGASSLKLFYRIPRGG